MQKNAQRTKNLWDTISLKEKRNLSGIAAEKFFNPQFQVVMDNLREVDGNIRSITTGKSVESGDPGKDSDSLKKIVQSAKSNLNRRVYMGAAAQLSRFRRKLLEIVAQINHLDTAVDKVHHQFLFQDLDPEHLKELQGLKGSLASQQNELLKEANVIADFLHNTFTEKGRALALYEKRYKKEAGALKQATINMIKTSESLLSQLISTLKEMYTARATRHVDNYVKGTDKIKKMYDLYNVKFQTYYNDNIKKFEEFINKNDTPAASVAEQGLGEQNVGTPEEEPFPLITQPVYTGQPQTPQVPRTLEMPEMPEIPSTPTTPVVTQTAPTTPPAPVEESAPISQPIPTISLKRKPPVTDPAILEAALQRAKKKSQTGQPADDFVVAKHKNFYVFLEALSGESPFILSSVIRKYAKSIQSSDPNTSIQLLQIASNIRS